MRTPLSPTVDGGAPQSLVLAPPRDWYDSCMSSRRAAPDRSFEEELWARGLRFVAGVDEAGRGALAGPVVVAAVVLRPGEVIDGVRDSKQLSPRCRLGLYQEILRRALAVGVGCASPREIDRLTIWGATCVAARRALRRLEVPVEHVLFDGALTLRDVHIPQTAVVHGDARVLSIASASIVAKVRRDRMMDQLDRNLPGYGFSRHKGYGTPGHVARLRELGPSRSHRLSFAPLAQIELWR